MEKNSKIENEDIIIKKKKVSNSTKLKNNVRANENKNIEIEVLEDFESNNIDVKPKKKRVITPNNKLNDKVKKQKKVLDSDIEIKPEKKKNKKKILSNSSKEKSKTKKILKNDDIDLINEVKFVPKKKRKLKKKFQILLWIILLVIIVIGIILGIKLFLNIQEEKEQARIKNKQEQVIKEINSHYNNYVLVKKDTMLYQIDEDNNFYEYGMVYANTEVVLDELEINHLTEYFYSTDLKAYLKYNDLEPINELKEYNNRYKNYIVFNQNVVTNEEFSLYDNDNKVYSFKKSMSFPIIIKDDNGKYYVEFNNRLLYVLKDDVKEIIKSNNTKTSNASRVTTLCYHRIYDKNEKCNDLYICKSKSNFEREMKYLSDNKFFTLTMEEMYLYLTKKIQVPKKSVVLTFDDGYLFANGIEILEKYNLHGTGFIKTGAFDDFSIFESDNFELQSHTDKMHVSGTCPRETSYQQGGGILCLPENTVLNDLKTSREKLNGAIALAYPFYDYNTRAIKLVKQAGFKLAFIGSNGVSGRSWPGVNTYKIPRMTIWNTTSFETFKGYVNN